MANRELQHSDLMEDQRLMRIQFALRLALLTLNIA
jgi:hypothetical protein